MSALLTPSRIVNRGGETQDLVTIALFPEGSRLLDPPFNLIVYSTPLPLICDCLYSFPGNPSNQPPPPLFFFFFLDVR